MVGILMCGYIRIYEKLLKNIEDDVLDVYVLLYVMDIFGWVRRRFGFDR